MDKKIMGGIATVMTLLLIGTLYNFVPELDDTHYCLVEEEITQSLPCNRLSGGLHTRCYLTNESTPYKVCGTGWKAIDRSDIPDIPYTIGKGRNVCDPKGCIPNE